MTTLLQTQVNELEEQARGFAGLKQLLVKSEGKTDVGKGACTDTKRGSGEKRGERLAEAKENARGSKAAKTLEVKTRKTRDLGKNLRKQKHK